MHKSLRLLLTVAITLATGCATSVPKPPPEFSLRRAAVVAASAESPLVLDGAPGKGKSAAVGAVAGAGVSLTIGGLACLATGPLMPACFAAVAPAVAVTAAGTAAYAGVTSDTAEDVQAKRDLLRAAMSAPAAHTRLAALVREQARVAAGAKYSPPTADAPEPRPDWNLLVTVTGLDTVGTGTDEPYALQVSADLELTLSQSEKPSFTKHYRAVSETKHTIAEWSANAGDPVQTALDGLLTKIASDMVAELMKNDQQPSS